MHWDDSGFEDHSSVVERRLRRRRLRRKARLRGLAVSAAAITLVAALVLLSPIGPFGDLIFQRATSAQPGGQEEVSREAAPNAATAGMAGEATGEALPTTQRVEKRSDPASPTIAVVVDDTGMVAERLEEWLAVDAPITFTAIPNCVATPGVVERLYAAGFRIMMHIPTENDPPNSFSGTGQLSTGMDRATVFATLDADLAQVPHATGINNHQGARGCNDLTLMTYQCEWAVERGLFIMDSDSSTDSQVTRAMANLGLPRRENQVFIDHDNDPEYIRSAMRRLADIARRDGTAIGICHFGRPNTARMVGEMILTLKAEGINFAFVQDVHN